MQAASLIETDLDDVDLRQVLLHLPRRETNSYDKLRILEVLSTIVDKDEISGLGTLKMYFEWCILTKTIEAAEKLVKVRYIRIQGEIGVLRKPGVREVNIKLQWLPFSVTNVEIINFLSTFGQVIELRRAFYKEPCMKKKFSGTRLIVLQLSEKIKQEDLPRVADIGGHQALLVIQQRTSDYEDTAPVLRNCPSKEKSLNSSEETHEITDFKAVGNEEMCETAIPPKEISPIQKTQPAYDIISAVLSKIEDYSPIDETLVNSEKCKILNSREKALEDSTQEEEEEIIPPSLRGSIPKNPKKILDILSIISQNSGPPGKLSTDEPEKKSTDEEETQEIDVKSVSLSAAKKMETTSSQECEKEVENDKCSPEQESEDEKDVNSERKSDSQLLNTSNASSKKHEESKQNLEKCRNTVGEIMKSIKDPEQLRTVVYWYNMFNLQTAEDPEVFCEAGLPLRTLKEAPISLKKAILDLEFAWYLVKRDKN